MIMYFITIIDEKKQYFILTSQKGQNGLFYWASKTS